MPSHGSKSGRGGFLAAAAGGDPRHRRCRMLGANAGRCGRKACVPQGLATRSVRPGRPRPRRADRQRVEDIARAIDVFAWQAGASLAPGEGEHDLAPASMALALAPVDVVSGGADGRRLAAGRMQDLATALARIEGLRVLPVGTAPLAAGEATRVGRQASVDWLLRAVIRRAERRARATLHLIDSAAGRSASTAERKGASASRTGWSTRRRRRCRRRSRPTNRRRPRARRRATHSPAPTCSAVGRATPTTGGARIARLRRCARGRRRVRRAFRRPSSASPARQPRMRSSAGRTTERRASRRPAGFWTAPSRSNRRIRLRSPSKPIFGRSRAIWRRRRGRR